MIYILYSENQGSKKIQFHTGNNVVAFIHQVLKIIPMRTESSIFDLLTDLNQSLTASVPMSPKAPRWLRKISTQRYGNVNHCY